MFFKLFYLYKNIKNLKKWCGACENSDRASKSKNKAEHKIFIIEPFVGCYNESIIPKYVTFFYDLKSDRPFFVCVCSKKEKAWRRAHLS